MTTTRKRRKKRSSKKVFCFTRPYPASPCCLASCSSSYLRAVLIRLLLSIAQHPALHPSFHIAAYYTYHPASRLASCPTLIYFSEFVQPTESHEQFAILNNRKALTSFINGLCRRAQPLVEVVPYLYEGGSSASGSFRLTRVFSANSTLVTIFLLDDFRSRFECRSLELNHQHLLQFVSTLQFQRESSYLVIE